MLLTEFLIDIGAPTPFSPGLPEGVLRLLGERPGAARQILPAGDGGGVPAPKPKPKPKPTVTAPATQPASKPHPSTSTPTRSTDQARTGATHTTPTAKPKPKPKPKPKAKPKPKPKAKAKVVHVTDLPTKSHVSIPSATHTKPVKQSHGKTTPATPATPVLSERDEIMQMKLAAGQQRLKLMRAQAKHVDGKHLDKQVPPEQRQTQYQKQQKLQHKLDQTTAPTKPPKGLSGQALHVWNELERPTIDSGKHEQALKLQQRYWSKHDTYVDKDGTVYAASFNPSTGKVDLERHDTVKTRPPAPVTKQAKSDQQQLHKQIKRAQDKAQARYDALPGGIRKFEMIDGPSLSQQQDQIAADIKAKYYSKHPLHVGKDGTVSNATVDPTTGAVTFEEQPDSIDLTRTQHIAVDGSRTKVTNAHGWLTNGYDSSTLTEDLDADGKPTGSTSNHHRDTTTHDVETVLDDTKVFDRKGVQTSGDQTVTIHDRAQGQDTVANTKSNFSKGRLTDTHSTVDVTGKGPEPDSSLDSHSTTDVTYDRKGRPTYMHSTGTTTVSGTTAGEGDDPDVEWKSVDKSETTVDGEGKPIYKPDGSLAVIPVSTLDREMTTRVKGAGQDDGSDLVTVTDTHAASNDEGDLVFDDYSHTKETSEGKDGSKGRTWDSPIDPTTGELTEPPEGWQPDGHAKAGATPDAYGGYVGDDGQYLQPPLEGDDLTEAWQQQNTDSFDDRSGWRKFKDGATKFAGIGAAVLGTALLFTGVGTGVGAALLIGSAALGTFALGSTVADYATGRNHVGWKDVALSAAMAIPGAGAGAARLGARAFGAAAKLGELSAGARALTATGHVLDTVGKASTAGYAAYTTGDTALRAIEGQPIGTMDVLNVLASYGGVKHAYVKPKVSGGGDGATTQGAPRVELPTVHDDVVVPRGSTTTLEGIPGTNVGGRSHSGTRGGRPSGDDPVPGTTTGADGAPDTQVGGAHGDGVDARSGDLPGLFGARVVETSAGPRILQNERTEPAPEVTYGTNEQKKFTKHAAAIAPELAGRNWNGEVRTQFRTAIDDVVSGARDGDGFLVDGTYQGDPVVFAYHASTDRMVVLKPDGEFVSGWKPSAGQLDGLTQFGIVGKSMSALDFGAMSRADASDGPLIYRSNRGHELTGLEDIEAMVGSRPVTRPAAADELPQFGRTITVDETPGMAPLERPIPAASEQRGGLRLTPGEEGVAPSLHGSVELDGGPFTVTDRTAAGDLVLSQRINRPTSIEDVIARNPELVQRLGGADAVRANPKLLAGEYLTIRRTDGTIEHDWYVSGKDAPAGDIGLTHITKRTMDVGEYIARRQQADPSFDGRGALRDVLEADTSLLSLRPLRLRRSDSSIAEGRAANNIDDGWTVSSTRRQGETTYATLQKDFSFDTLPAKERADARAQGYGPGDRVRVVRDNVSLDEIIDYNRARLEGDHGQLPDIDVRVGTTDGPSLGTNRELDHSWGATSDRADQAVTHVRAALDYLYSRYGYRPSGDDFTLVIDSSEAPNNATMSSSDNVLRIGTHDQLGGAFDPSVVMHELGHKVVHDLTAGSYDKRGVSGAIHEGVADVLAAAWTHDPIIGRLFNGPGGQAIRDIRSGERLVGSANQWNALADAEGGVGAHRGSGVVSGIAQRIAGDTGRPAKGDLGWGETGDLFYEAMQSGGMRYKMDFESLSDSLRIAAARRYGVLSDEFQRVTNALTSADLISNPAPGTRVARLTSRQTIEHDLTVVGYDPLGFVFVRDAHGREFRQAPQQLLTSGGRDDGRMVDNAAFRDGTAERPGSSTVQDRAALGMDYSRVLRESDLRLAPQGYVSAPSWMTPEFRDRMGRVAEPTTQRSTEQNGILPGTQVTTVRAGQPLDVNALDRSRKYLWLVDPDGNFVIAPEQQNGRTLKHGNLVPASPAGGRGFARTGGELSYGVDGRWHINNNSSYAFARLPDGFTFVGHDAAGNALINDSYGRQYAVDPATGLTTDGRTTLRDTAQDDGQSFYAVWELLERSGSDLSNVAWDDLLRRTA
jgi:hypothetical protein